MRNILFSSFFGYFLFKPDIPALVGRGGSSQPAGTFFFQPPAPSRASWGDRKNRFCVKNRIVCAFLVGDIVRVIISVLQCLVKNDHTDKMLMQKKNWKGWYGTGCTIQFVTVIWNGLMREVTLLTKLVPPPGAWPAYRGQV